MGGEPARSGAIMRDSGVGNAPWNTGASVTSEELSDAAEGSPPAPSGSFSDLLRQLAAAPVVSFDADWQAKFAPGQKVGRFELLRELGRGGFGVVYEARDTEIGRRVALKAVRTGRRSSLRRERLLQEAEVAAHLSHPNIVTVFDYGRCDDGPYLILELLRGESLHARMARGPIPLPEAVRIGTEVARGLAHAHGLGVVHRDLTPGNVFLGADGAVKVLDFGLAHAFGRPRIDGGTPAFMSPEQWSGAPEDERTDVFSLGVILHRLLTGKLPYPADSGKAARPAAPARALDVPGAPELTRLVARMLEPDPALRPRDGQEVLAALLALQERLLPSGSAPVPASRRAWVRALALAAVLAATAAAARVFFRSAGAQAGRVGVVVADVRNLTGDQDLDALSALLAASLEQSSRLAVVSRSRALGIARESGRGQVARIDEVLGTEVARRAKAAGLLVPTVHRIGSSYILELRAVDPQTDSTLFPVRPQQTGSKNGVLSLVDQLSAEVRERFGEPAKAIAASRVRATGGSGTLEAYRHYFAGQLHFHRWELAEAEREFQGALDADPGFALAHVDLYELAALTSRDEEAAEHLAKALERIERIPEKHRKIVLLAKATADRLGGEGGEAGPVLEQAQEIVDAHPADKDVLFAAAKALGTIRGKLGRGRSRELLQQILALEPTRLDAAQKLVIEHWLPAGRCEEAWSVARGVGGLGGGSIPPMLLTLAFVCQGRAEEAVAAARAAIAAGGGGDEALVLALAASFRLDEAEQRLEKLTSPEVDPTLRRYYLPERARLLAIRGRRREALQLLDGPEGVSGSAWKSARKRILEAGFASAPRLEGAEDIPRDAPESQALRLADAAREKGRLEEAARLYRELIADLPLEARVLDEGFIAELLIEAGRPAEALQLLGGPERALAALSPGAVPRGIYLRALAQERLGRRDLALAEVDRLLGLWGGADSDLPLLGRAKELRRRILTRP
jgi:tetratricopeptide (TPR) repeat protein